MRRFWTLAGAVMLALGLALAVPAAASASGLTVAPGACDSSAYPPKPHATIMASTTTPFVGETIEASGTVYCPDEDVRITLAGEFVTTTHTDLAGDFDPPVKVTQVGRLRLCGIGASGLPNDRDCLMLTVKAHDQGGGGPSPGGGGGTSFTGVDILLIVLAAVALLGAGFGLVVAGRRKRPLDPES